MYSYMTSLLPWISLIFQNQNSLIVSADVTSELLIGVISASENTVDGRVLGVELAVKYVNSRDDLLPTTKLTTLTNTTDSMLHTLQYVQNVCYQVENGAQIIIGPEVSSSVRATSAVPQFLHIPQIAPSATDPTLSLSPQEFPYLIKMNVPDTYQSEALLDLAQSLGWTRFAIIASIDDYGINFAQAMSKRITMRNWELFITKYFYPTVNVSDLNIEGINHILTAVKHKGARVILLFTHAPYARVILRQAKLHGMTEAGWAWMVSDGVTTLDGLFEGCAEVPDYLQGVLGSRPTQANGLLYPVFEQMWAEVNAARNISLNSVSQSQAFDAVLTVAYGLHSYLQEEGTLSPTQFPQGICSTQGVEPWIDGRKLMNHMQKVNGPGSMNHINFTAMRTPWLKEFEFVNLQAKGWFTVGDWVERESPHLSTHEAIMFPGQTYITPPDVTSDLRNISLRVVTILEEPYIMETTAKEREIKPDVLYKGYCMDLLEELRSRLGFEYELYVVEDGNYGALETVNGSRFWNGIVGDLIYGKADISVSPLTISYEREQVIDFTKPYQDLGLIILMSKEHRQNDLMAFLQPFEWQLWCAVGAAFVVSAVATTFCSYVSPFGYRGRYVQRRDVKSSKWKEQSNTLSLIDSLWFSFASWMQQGSDVAPVSFSGRLIHGFWWFTVMVISATYTANLAAFLTIARLDSGISSLEDLSQQTTIEYGTVANSEPESYFSSQDNDPYRVMWAFMRDRDTFVSNTTEGIRRVLNGYGKPNGERYAFIFDSSPLEYASHAEPCDSTVVGRIFHNFGYGIALGKNSPFTEMFSLEVLQLRQSGFQERLYNVWFSGTCPPSTADSATTTGEQATLLSMAGVFYFMLAGIVISILALLCECCLAAVRDVKASRYNKTLPNTLCASISKRTGLVVKDISQSMCPCCERHTETTNQNSEYHHSTRRQVQGQRPIELPNGYPSDVLKGESLFTDAYSNNIGQTNRSFSTSDAALNF